MTLPVPPPSARDRAPRIYPADLMVIGEGMVELSAPVPLDEAQSFQRAYAGDALNTAVAASRLGSKVVFVTRLGQDPFSPGLRDLLQTEGLDTDHIRTVSASTGLCFLHVDAAGERQMTYYRNGSAASTLDATDIDPVQLRQCKIVFATGVTLSLSPSARKAVMHAFRLAKEAGCFTAFDPNFRKALWQREADAFDALSQIMPLVDIFLPTMPDDTEPLLGFSRVDQLMDFCWFKGVKVVVIKQGALGCTLGYKGESAHLPALAGSVVDTTGAGDAFNGGFLHALADGQSLVDCARSGIVTAGLKVRQRGTLSALPSSQDVALQLVNVGG